MHDIKHFEQYFEIDVRIIEMKSIFGKQTLKLFIMKRLKQKMSIVLLVLLAVFAGIPFYSCDKMTDKTPGTYAPSTGISEEYAAENISSDMNDNEVSRGSESALPSAVDNIAVTVPEKKADKIIKNAEVRFQVKNYEAGRQSILTIVKDFSAYVSSEAQTTNYDNIENRMVIRVTSDKFDPILDKLMATASYVDFKTITSEDVTEQFVDAEARLKSKKEVEARYLDLLKKTGSINDILNVEQHLRIVREEIEVYEGRLKYLSDKVAFSTITITFYEKTGPAVKPDRTFSKRFMNAISKGWSGFVHVIIAITYLWPLLVLMFIGLIIILIAARKKRSRNK